MKMGFGRAGNSKMNKLTEAYNSVKSTLSKSWSATKQGASLNQDALFSGMGAAKGFRNRTGAFGNSLKESWKNGDNWTKGGQVASAGIGAGAATAAADFVNPWGLGWGD
jgi:hypothetical protein